MSNRYPWWKNISRIKKTSTTKENKSLCEALKTELTKLRIVTKPNYFIWTGTEQGLKKFLKDLKKL